MYLVSFDLFLSSPLFFFFSLIKLVVLMLRTREQEVTQAKSKLRHGLENLSNANKSVEEMKKQLSELQPQLAEKVAITDQLLTRISDDQLLFDGVMKVVVVEEAEVYQTWICSYLFLSYFLFTSSLWFCFVLSVI